MFSDQDDTIVSCAHENTALFDGGNKNLITYKNIKSPYQKFKYDMQSKKLTAIKTGFAIGVDGNRFAKGSNIVSFSKDKDPGH